MKAVDGDGRYLAIIDPKGEYGPVAADLGLSVVRLQPGGSSRVNPMDPARGDGDDSVIARQSLAAQLVAGVLGRDLAPLEDAVLGWAVEQRCRTGGPFTLRDLCSEILDPPDELVRLFREKDFDALIAVGGDGSLGIACVLQEKGLRVVGVPKTIDNDLEETVITLASIRRSPSRRNASIDSIPRPPPIEG